LGSSTTKTVTAGSKPTGCPKGKTAVTVLGARRCVVTAEARLPQPDQFLMVGSLLTRDLIEGRDSAAIDHALAREAKPGRPAPGSNFGSAGRDIHAIGATFDTLVGKAKTWPYDAGVGRHAVLSPRSVREATTQAQAAEDGPTTAYGNTTSSETASGV